MDNKDKEQSPKAKWPFISIPPICTYQTYAL